MKKYKIVALCGQAGAGKDALLNALAKLYPQENKIVSHTTRSPREYEKNGKDYYFVSPQEFERLELEGKMLESSWFNSWSYGTSLLALEENKLNFGVFNPEGLRSLDKNPSIQALIIICDCPDNIRLIRQLGREKDPNIQEIIRRYYADKNDFSDLDFTERENTIVMRTDGSLTVKEEANILKQYIDDWAKFIK